MTAVASSTDTDAQKADFKVYHWISKMTADIRRQLWSLIQLLSRANVSHLFILGTASSHRSQMKLQKFTERH